MTLALPLAASAGVVVPTAQPATQPAPTASPAPELPAPTPWGGPTRISPGLMAGMMTLTLAAFCRRKARHIPHTPAR